jgi:hypothetical protein
VLATTSASFLPHCEQRIRVASRISVADRPVIRASAPRTGRKI